MKMRAVFSKIFPVVLFLALTLVLFYKTFFGLYPYAGNLLVSFFFPWSSGGFAGYDSWTTHKEFIGSDSIRMQLPWKELAFDLIKKGKLPLWNPYNFSGSPLLANYQSGLFYPLNIFYLIFPPLTAWTLLTMFQVFLAMVFMYLLLRKFKLSKPASVLGSLAFVSSSFFITWVEIDIIGHTYLWLPLIIYFIESILVEGKKYFYPAISLAIAFSIFAGYPQTAILVILYSAFYFLFRVWSLSKKRREVGGKIIHFLFFLVLGLGLAAIQLIPTFELYCQAPLAKEFARWTFEHFLIPYRQLATFFAPDFFGNPATNNFWGKDYGDLTPSIGVVPLFFALLPLLLKRKEKLIKFLYVSSFIFLLLAVKSPLSYLVQLARLPILSSSNPARILSLLFFNFSILAAFGFDEFITGLKKRSRLRQIGALVIIFLIIYASVWSLTVFGAKIFTSDETLISKLSVTKRNLILPTMSFAIILGVFTVYQWLGRAKSLTGILKLERFVKQYLFSLSLLAILAFVFLNLFYRLHKYNPFSPKKFYFPSHPVTEFLKEKSVVPDRFYGVETAHFGDNFATFYQIYAAEGYDALRILRYAELAAAVEKGEVPKEYLRSDARFPKEDSENRKRIFNLLGVKYILDKDDAATKAWEPQPWKFPEDRFEMIWQEGKFKVYQNKEALPRAFLVNDYLVLKEGSEIIKKIFSSDFDPSKTIILETDPSVKLKSVTENLKKAEIVSYTPNGVIIETSSDVNSFLFLSDSFYPGWKAFVDGRQTQIYRANYAFRAVVVPGGNHQVAFSYEPLSFKAGLATSALSLFFCSFLTTRLLKESKT